MRKIYTVGEAIYDIIFVNNKPVDAKVGGAMINSSVSLGRLGLPINYIGDTAKDAVGEIMRSFLIDNNVNIDHFAFYPDSKSRLALAFLDDINSPKYSFYKINTPQKVRLDFPEINKDDIILFGSFYGIKAEVRGALVDFLLEAKRKDAIILYDPNFRPNHKSLLSTVLPFIEDNIRIADLVKASNEDFDLIFGSNTFDEVLERVDNLRPKSLIYTRNENGIDWTHKGQMKHFDVQKLEPVSAVGAGDTFNAGLIYYIYKNNISKDQLKTMGEEQWHEMLATADSFAANVCMSTDNYISEEFAKSIIEG
ncbi:MAG: carbohydrate kinase [Bacteroidetes bacterium 4572_112]|nr:MAG: carbohydrate kinase [Bacteroidetes bacterium 4572_112]